MAEVDPQFATAYDDRTTVAVKSVLVEIGQILGGNKAAPRRLDGEERVFSISWKSSAT
jgi:hypothetical protein